MTAFPKIAIVNTTHSTGGAAKAAVSLLNAFNDSEVLAEARMFHCGNKVEQNALIGLNKAGSRFSNALLSRLSGSMNVFDYGVARQILNETRHDDVLHVHNLHGYYLDYKTLLTGWGSERPIIWTWHDMWGATGRCAFSFDCDLWKSGCPSCPNKSAYPAAWIDRAGTEIRTKFEYFSSLPNLRIVTPSKWLAKVASERGYSENIISTIPYPVKTDVLLYQNKSIARQKLNLNVEQDNLALFIAYDCNDERKGYLDFARVTKEAGCKGVVVGKLPMKPCEHLVHVGVVNDEELLCLYYAAADVMVIPSYADNYPNTVLESLCCGTPVIGYNVGGLESMLSMDGCAGVPVGNMVLLAEELTNFMRSVDGLKCSADISKNAHEKWDPVMIAKRYLEVLD